MTLKTAMVLAALVPLICACAGMYVAGDAGPHRNTNNLHGDTNAKGPNAPA